MAANTITDLIRVRLVLPIVTAIMKPPARLVIVSRGRTGSTLLVSLLKSHPAIRIHGEVVGESVMRDQTTKARILAVGPVEYVKRRLSRTLFEKVAGIKILYYQLESDYMQTWKAPGLAGIRDYIQSERCIKVIHLTRLNRLRTLASIRIAAVTKEYRTHDPVDDAKRPRISLTIEECEDEFVRIGRWEQSCRAAFKNHDFLETSYETLVDAWQDELDRILEFLGVRSWTLKTRMKKQSKRSLADTIENYESLKTHFSGTEWSPFFSD